MIDYRPSHLRAIAIYEKELREIIQKEPHTHTKNRRYQFILKGIKFHKSQLKKLDGIANNG